MKKNIKKNIIRRLMAFFDKRLEHLASLYFEKPMMVVFEEVEVND